jgi:class 3 adenylate cyclase
MAREFQYSWKWDLEPSPEALWPLVSDTNRFNRDTGQPPMQLLGFHAGVRRVRWKIPLFPIEWEEEPFDWIYPYHFGILRRFKTGPLAEMRVSVELARTEQGGTRLTYQTWLTPANFLGTIGIPIAIGIVAARRFEATFHLYARMVEHGGSVAEVSGWRKLSSNGRARLRSTRERLLAEGANAPALDRLAEFLDRADDLSVQRMRPFALADGWGLPRRAVLETFLRATRGGLLDMYWELLCPECRGVTEGHGHLKDVHADSHCNTCNIDFTANFDHNVEVIFRPNAAVRPLNVNIEFCVGSPQRQPHVVFSQLVTPLKNAPVPVSLEAGRYSLRASGIPGSQAVTAESNGMAAPVFRLTDFGWPYEEQRVATHPTLNLVNATEALRTFSLERTTWSDQAATAADVTTLQIFRDLFASEVLRPGEEISVGNVTLLFTDLRESTRLYRQMGDASAYGRVREHFVMLERAVAAQGGAIVKTMGDSIMAAFQHPAAALRAIQEAQALMASDTKQPLLLKAGIHRGPCIVVNQNDRLDYFGSTVNIAARLPNFSEGGEVIFSSAIQADPEVAAYLVEQVRPTMLTRFQSGVKGYDEPIELWRLKL